MTKFFVDRAGSYIGQALIEELRNDHLEGAAANSFYVLSEECGCEGPLFTKLPKKRPNEVFRGLQDSHTIILDLHCADLEELEYYLRRLHSESSPKTVILISDVLVWGDTPPKLRELTEEESCEDLLEPSRLTVSAGLDNTTLEKEESQDPASGEEQQETVEKGLGPEESVERSLREEVLAESLLKKPARFRILPFEGTDSPLRRALPKYEAWKTLENLVLKLNQKENLQGYVICAGILYGNGEQTFETAFSAAWTERSEGATYIATGHNLLPTVHVTDLARIVKATAEALPQQKYLFAVDSTAQPTQRGLIQSISSYLGNGRAQEQRCSEGPLQSCAESLMLNLWVTPPELFLPGGSAAVEWHCLRGIPENILLLSEEFNLYRGLTALKVFISGPPASGKSYYGRKLAENFNLPYISIGPLIEEALATGSEAGAQLRETITALKQQMIEEAELKKKKTQEIDYSKLNPRVPDSELPALFRAKLCELKCLNRGYVLDGYPRKFEEAENLFSCTAKGIWPNRVVAFKATNEFLTQRVKSLPEAYTVGTHFTDEGMKRRLGVYRDFKGPAVHEFFTQEALELEAATDPLEVSILLKDYMGQVSNFREFKAPRPLPGETYDRILDSGRLTKEVEPEEERKEPGKPERNEMEELLLIEQIKAKEKDMLELKSQPYRHYLFTHVMPWLFEGILQVTRQQPQDPVEALAQYLELKSRELNHLT